MSVTDLNAARWDRSNDPAKHAPTDALHAAIRDLAKEDRKIAHVVVSVAFEHDDNAVSAAWWQSGSYNAHGQLGLLERVKTEVIASAF